MRKALSMLATTFVVMSTSGAMLAGAKAADLSAGYTPRTAALSRNCQDIVRCGPDGCNTFHLCSRPCPDGTSCFPLYGAYGPYGGVGYWGAYTDSGWGYH
jgi:hypothetical protein